MELVFNNLEIKKAILNLSSKISEYLSKISSKISYKISDSVHFITILKEGIHFSVDLSKALSDYDLILDYIFLENINPENRELAIEKDIFLPVKNKVVIVCSVLTRTGYEITFIENYLKIRGAKDIKTVSLICKEGTLKKPDFYHFTVPDGYYLVGYGLDYHEKYRNLENIYKI